MFTQIVMRKKLVILYEKKKFSMEGQYVTNFSLVPQIQCFCSFFNSRTSAKLSIFVVFKKYTSIHEGSDFEVRFFGIQMFLC